MALVTHSPYDINGVIDVTRAIQNIDPQFGLIINSGLFNETPLSTDTFIFDKMDTHYALIPKSSRRDGVPTKSTRPLYKPFTLTLAYRHHVDHITPHDLQGVRQFDSFTNAEQLMPVVNRKLTKLRAQMEQTQEFLALGAVMGKVVDPDGDTLIDMFDTFGITQTVQSFDLSTPATNVQEKIRTLLFTANRALRTGQVPKGMTVWCADDFFNALVVHPTIVQAYTYYISQPNLLRDGTTEFGAAGVSNSFRFGNVLFRTYPSYFRLGDDTIQEAIPAGTAWAVLDGVDDLFRSFYGPANTLMGANKAGEQMFATQYTDPRGKFIDLEVEGSSAYICTQPQTLIKLTMD